MPVLCCNEATGPVGPVGPVGVVAGKRRQMEVSLAAYVAGTSSTNWGIVRCHRWSPVFFLVGGKIAKQTVEKWCSGGKKGLKYFTDFEQMNLEMEPWLKAVSRFYHLPIGSMVLVYMLTWLGYIDGINVTIYRSTMDPMGYWYSFIIPSGKHTKSYWTWWFSSWIYPLKVVDLSIVM